MSESNRDSLASQLNSFFFTREVPYGMALGRIVLCGTLLYTMVYRWFFAREIYSTDGAIAQLSVAFGQGNLLPELPGTAVVALVTILCCALFCGMIGWQTRISLVLSLVLYNYFAMLDALSTITKYSVIAAHFMLLMAIADSGAVWSVDSWFSGRSRARKAPWEPRIVHPASTVWPARLVQLFMGLVYLGAAATKLHTPAYFSGDQLKFWMVTQMNHIHPLGDYLTLHPALVVIMCYIAVVWELTFVFLVFSRYGRLPMVWLGILFHAMTSLTLGLYIFPMVMFGGYCAFLRESDIQWCAQQLRRLKRRWHLPTVSLPRLAAPSSTRPSMAGYSLLLFAVAILVTTSAGVKAEAMLDLYGQRRAEGRYQLQPMPIQQAAKMLRNDEDLREKDRVYSLRLGTMTMSGIILDPRKEFTQGDTLIVQAALIPPHGDMYIECFLLDEHGTNLHRHVYLCPREVDLVTFNYNLCEEVPAGNYQILLQVNNKPVHRQSFVVRPGVCKR